MSNGEDGTSAPVIKVGLKRINLDERVFGDDELRGCALVKLLGEERTRALLAKSQGRRFADRARIFLEGDPSDALVFLLKGEARLWMKSGKDAADIATLRKGDLMGEREALGDSHHRTFSAEAVGDVELVEFPRAVLSGFLQKAPAFERHLRDLAKAREAAGAEMSDFLNRW